MPMSLEEVKARKYVLDFDDLRNVCDYKIPHLISTRILSFVSKLHVCNAVSGGTYVRGHEDVATAHDW